MSDILSSNLDLIIIFIMSYVVGVISVISYMKLKEMLQFPFNREEKTIQSIVSEYTHRLNYYDKAIAELRVKIDTMELRVMQRDISQNSSQTNNTNTKYYKQNIISHQDSQLEQQHNHISTVSNMADITQAPGAISRHLDSYNGTMDFILKILIERPRTSREIQHSVGRTREHTSRLMKKLYDSKLVIRDSNSKPFKYSITDAGRIQLMGHHGKDGGIVYDGSETHADSTDSQLPAMA
ncbi:MAG TPA: winged helix-turn-helix domain-containing protein [Nitrososphaeraceae archaeon]|jgi:hypothetical protein|nr:winged helix-turn-helix domain-containing protein [Nitrososphaeraceae archaeon]